MTMHGFPYKKFRTLQHDKIEDALIKLFTSIYPRRVIEIGTAEGGLTLLIRSILDKIGLKDSQLTTYDILYEVELAYFIKMNDLNISYKIADIFDKLDELGKLIQEDGPTVVFCDGGNKSKEFNVIAPLLKQGDVILAHDYTPNQTYFEAHTKKDWARYEIQDSDIVDICAINNLAPFKTEIMTPVVWACRRKQ